MQLAGRGNLSAGKRPPPCPPPEGEGCTLAEELTELLGVTNCVIRVAVVEDRMHVRGAFGHGLELGRPRLELVRLVEVAELLRRTDALLLPVLSVVTVEAHHAERRRG